MARVETVLVSSTKAYEATGPDGSIVTVKNQGPDSCVYATASTVSSGSNDGTLTSGSTLAFGPSKYFLSSGTSELTVSTALPGEQIRQYDKDEGQAGMYAMSCQAYACAVLTLVANRGYAVRFVPSRPMLITNIAYALTTFSASDDPVDVGIYDSTLNNRLGSSGVTTGKLNTAIGVKSVNLTAAVPLKPGIPYYAALAAGTLAGAPVIMGIAPNAIQAAQLFGTTGGTVEVDGKATMHPLPTAWGAVGAATSLMPLLAVRES